MLHRWAPVWSTITTISVTSMVGSVYLAQAPGLTEEMLQMWCKLKPELCAGMQAPSRPQPVFQATPPVITQPQPVSSAAAVSSATAALSSSSAAPSAPATQTVTSQDTLLGLELKGPVEGRIGTNMFFSIKIFNRTSKQMAGISYSVSLPMTSTSSIQPGAGCSLNGRVLTCTNLVIPAGSSFFASFNVPVTQQSCALPASLPVTTQKISQFGTVESSVSAIHRWSWNCTYEPVTTDVVDVTAVIPVRVRADKPVSLPITVKNKKPTAVSYRIVLPLPEGVTPVPLPGCGQGGPMLMCFSETLAGNAQFTHVFGTLQFSRALCGQTVQLDPVRAEATTTSGPAIIYGRTLKPIAIEVECDAAASAAASSRPSSSSSLAISSAASSSSSRAGGSASAALDRFSLSNGTVTCVTSDCRTVSVPVTLRNSGPTPATRVAMIATMDTAWSNATLQGVSCLTMNINGTTERRFMCPGGFDLTVPAGATAQYSITLTTSLPCPITNPRTEVLIQAAPASVYEEDYSNNSVFVPLPRPCQTASSSRSSAASSSIANLSSTASSSAAEFISLQSVTINGQYVRVDYTKNFDTCVHMRTTTGQITHAQNYFCRRTGPTTIDLTAFNTLFGAGKSFKLCHGNNQNFCSNTVTVAEEEATEQANLNPVYMRFPLEGQWNWNPNPCTSKDCRRVVLPLEFVNRTATSADVQISGVVGSMWNTMTVKGLSCSLRSNATPNGRTFTCPGVTVAPNTQGLTVGVVLTSTAPCPVAAADFVNLAFTGALKTAQQFPTEIARTVPLPCTTNAAAQASAAASSAGIVRPVSSSSSKAAASSYAPVICGNGIVQAFEICDDGNKIDTDSCRNNCTINFNPQTCGNGIPEGTEQCDDGNMNDADACSTKCTILDYTPPPVSIENLTFRTEKDRNGGGILYISGNLRGTLNPLTQRVLLSFEGANSFLNAAADSASTFNFTVRMQYNKTYVPTIQVTERLSVYKTVVIGEKKMDPITFQAPPAVFSAKDHYGLFVTPYATTGNLKSTDSRLPPNLTSWVARGDALCNLAAQDAGLDGVWHSMLSYRPKFPLYNIRNELLAETEEDLWSVQRGNLPARVTNVFGDEASGYAWTGRDGTGKIVTNTCKSWSSNLMPDTGAVGLINGRGGDWYQSTNQYCYLTAALYCTNELAQ